MPTYRTVFRYHFMLGNKIVQTGITSNLDSRETKLCDLPGWAKGRVAEVGDRVSYETAVAWLEEQRKQGRPVEARPA